MSHDWTPDVEKYAASCDTAAVDGIDKYLRIALQSRNGSLVACHDKVERGHFLKKKLGPSNPNNELECAIMVVCERMEAERDKPRVTFYYLFAEKYGKLARMHPR